MKAEIGSISHATMRNEDLIPVFLEELKRLDDGTHARLIKDIEQNQNSTTYDDYYESEDAQWDLEELFDALNEHAPPYCYFGAHQGDGSDYGFWPNIESIEQEIQDGNIVNIDGPDMPEAFVQINDHGNITLYDRQMCEIWSIV